MKNILEWLNSNFDAGDAIIFGLIAFAIWFVFWKLISKLFWKHKLYSILELGAVGSFGILIFLSLIVVLFIASIQAVIGYGAKLLIPLIIFWGGVITFFVFLIRKLRK